MNDWEKLVETLKEKNYWYGALVGAMSMNMTDYEYIECQKIADESLEMYRDYGREDENKSTHEVRD